MRCCIRATEQSTFYAVMQKEILQYEIKLFIYITKMTLAYKINVGSIEINSILLSIVIFTHLFIYLFKCID